MGRRELPGGGTAEYQAVRDEITDGYLVLGANALFDPRQQGVGQDAVAPAVDATPFGRQRQSWSGVGAKTES